MQAPCCCSVRTIILGVGNPICGDDGVGLHVVQQMRKHVDDPDVTMEETLTSGLPLVERLAGYDRAIIIDSIRDCNAEAGGVRRLTADAFASTMDLHPHGIDFGTALSYLKKISDEVPEIVVIGIVIGKCELAEQLSPAVAAAVPRAVEMVFGELER